MGRARARLDDRRRPGVLPLRVRIAEVSALWRRGHRGRRRAHEAPATPGGRGRPGRPTTARGLRPMNWHVDADGELHVDLADGEDAEPSKTLVTKVKRAATSLR